MEKPPSAQATSTRAAVSARTRLQWFAPISSVPAAATPASATQVCGSRSTVK